MTEYTECDQCIRRCPVDHLRCENGWKRYLEVTGKEYRPTENEQEIQSKAQEDSGAAYRRKIRERRARRKSQNESTKI